MIIFSGTDKGKIIDLIWNAVKELIYPGVLYIDIEHLNNHLLWMERHPGQLHVTARLETFPETETTNLLISASFKRSS